MNNDGVDGAELKKVFIDFFEKQTSYEERIKNLMATRGRRLDVSLDDVRLYCNSSPGLSEDLAIKLLDEPAKYLTSLNAAVEEIVRNSDPKYLSTRAEIKVSLTGNYGNRSISPRELLSHFVEKLVSVKGIVTKCSAVRPKLSSVTQFCSTTEKFSTRVYRDATALKGAPTSFSVATRDENGNALTTEYGLSSYCDQQSITIQEMPEHAPSGQLPRSVEVILEDDLVDICKPGDRVNIVGIYKVLPASNPSASCSGVFRTLLVAIGVKQLCGEISAPDLTMNDIELIEELVKQSPASLLNLLGTSLAPSIYGHDTIKKALILLLIGGVEKNLKNGTHIRGDINCLMVGDPSVAKSQLLRCVMGVAPFAISTTGRGSSGVGLTAAVSTDQDTGERRLEAGAMVLADRGIVCIDEFDKMNDADRVAIHEVMEQQTVTVAKAGIHASLNARCSVLAAANPIYGTYDHSQPVPRNINLPDSLLSRFDILFVVLDQSTASNDRCISSHVLSMHSSQSAQSIEANTSTNKTNMDGINAHKSGFSHPSVLSKSFLKKFIFYVKKRPDSPELTAEAELCLAERYSLLRSRNSEQQDIPVTARTLETMIRLSTAHAKMRLSKTVEEHDALVALEILQSVMETEQGSSLTLNEPCTYSSFCRAFARYATRRQSLSVTEVVDAAHSWEECKSLSTSEIDVFLHQLQNAGRILLDDEGHIHCL